MIQGVNHQVVEVTQPECEFFERVIFFVKPEFSSVSQGTLKERARIIAGDVGAPPPTKVKIKKLISAGKLLAAATAGAAVAMLLMRFVY